VRRALIVAAALAAAGCAAVKPAPDDAVRIDVSTLADGRLHIEYRVPPGVQRLPWVDRDPRTHQLVREAMLKPADGCARVEPDALVYTGAPGCDGAARFDITPRVLARNAMYEPAQPSSDGSVLLHTRYFAAALPGHALRWRFLPPAGGQVIDGARAWDSPREVAADAAAVDAALATLEREASWRALHATRSVFIGRTALEQGGELLWVRDPALPAALADPVAQTARAALRAYEAATGLPAGGAAVVMLRVASGTAAFHGDRSDERMIRLSFTAPPDQPTPAYLDGVRHFVAHEVAHLWNHGVFDSDMNAPWLHEGDADWATALLLHDQGVLSDDALRRQLEGAVNGCLLARGARPAATLKTAWGSGEDDPYACGVALQLLSWAAQHARDPKLRPLAAWGALHRAHPNLDAAGFSRHADGDGAALLKHLLLTPGVPFAPAFVQALGTHLPLQPAAGEPDPRLAANLAGMLVRPFQAADCGGFSFWTQNDHVALDAGLRCKTLPAGARLGAVAGEPLFARPLAAWRAAQALCAQGRAIPLGLKDGGSVDLACPPAFPPVPALVSFAPDALQRIGLASR
jgi:hypothetical protein